MKFENLSKEKTYKSKFAKVRDFKKAWTEKGEIILKVRKGENLSPDNSYDYDKDSFVNLKLFFYK